MVSKGISELDQLLIEMNLARQPASSDTQCGLSVGVDLGSEFPKEEFSSPSAASPSDTSAYGSQHRVSVDINVSPKNRSSMSSISSGASVSHQTPKQESADYSSALQTNTGNSSTKYTGPSDLDDLMASIASYRQPVVNPRDSAGDKLDSMIGALTQNLESRGHTAANKGCCAQCGGVVVGQVITALGKIFHPEHFLCSHCHRPLGTEQPFFEVEGEALCENDYFENFAPRCAHCNGPINDKVVNALGKDWHPEHFVCAACGRVLGSTEGYHEHDGRPYCRSCHEAHFAPLCRACGKPIVADFVSALGGHFHTSCFVCADCGCDFNKSTLMEYNGQALCENHFYLRQGAVCAQCRSPIVGRCVTALKMKYHPDHFCCVYCNKQLNAGTFKEKDGKPYCHSCFKKCSYVAV